MVRPLRALPRVLLGCAGALVLATACTDTEPAPSAAALTPAALTPAPRATTAIDRARSFSSLEELRAATEVVAVVTARPGARVVERSALASTLTAVDVEQVLQGDGARVSAVEQLGTLPPGGLEVPGQVLLEGGRRYLLFLQQARPDDPGTYAVVGVTAGLYAADPADPGRFLAQSGADDVPRALTPAELVGPS